MGRDSVEPVHPTDSLDARTHHRSRLSSRSCISRTPRLRDGLADGAQLPPCVRLGGRVPRDAECIADPRRGRLVATPGQLLDLAQLLVIEEHLQPLGHGLKHM